MGEFIAWEKDGLKKPFSNKDTLLVTYSYTYYTRLQ